MIGLLLLCGLAGSGAGTVERSLDSPSTLPVREVSVHELCRLALQYNQALTVAKYTPRITAAEVKKAVMVYGFSLTSELNRNRAKEPQVSSIFGTMSEAMNFNVGVSKRFPTGAVAELGWTNLWSSTDAWSSGGSLFTTVNPVVKSAMVLSVSQPLLHGFRDVPQLLRISLALGAARLSEMAVRQQAEQLLWTIQTAFWDYVYGLEALSIRRASIEDARALLALLEKKERVGLVEPSDILGTKAAIALRDMEVVVAEAQLKDAEDRLISAANAQELREKWELVPKESLTFEAHPVQLSASLARGKAHRLDLAQARAQLAQARLGVESARIGTLPTFNAIGRFALHGLGGDVGADVTDLVSGKFNTWFFGASLSWPLGTSAADVEVERAALAREQEEARVVQLEQDLETELIIRIRGLKVQARRIELSRQAETLQRLKLEQEDLKYRQGRSNSRILLEHQEDLRRAQLGVARALADHQKALVDLELAEGRLLARYEEATP